MDCIYIAPLSKALFKVYLSFTHSHTNGDWLPCKAPTSSSGAIGGKVSCSGTLRHTQGGIELATLRLPDDSSYHLSHIARFFFFPGFWRPAPRAFELLTRIKRTQFGTDLRQCSCFSDSVSTFLSFFTTLFIPFIFLLTWMGRC